MGKARNYNNNQYPNTQDTQKLSVTSLRELETYKDGKIIELPPFAEGQPFVAKIKRPSMLALVKEGKIPNSLLTSANSIFQNGVGSYDSEDKEALKELFDVIDIICDASLVEPTLQDIKDIGLSLTDEQMMFLFSYTQNGVKALDSFR